MEERIMEIKDKVLMDGGREGRKEGSGERAKQYLRGERGGGKKRRKTDV